MIRWASTYFGSIPPVFIDGLTYALIALFGALSSSFGSDEAKQFIKPVWIFGIKTFCASCGATLLAIKMFRSTSYSEHQQQKKDDATRIFVKQNIPAP